MTFILLQEPSAVDINSLRIIIFLRLRLILSLHCFLVSLSLLKTIFVSKSLRLHESRESYGNVPVQLIFATTLSFCDYDELQIYYFCDNQADKQRWNG